jgi:hypothetical protein
MVSDESEEPKMGSSRVKGRPGHDAEGRQSHGGSAPLTPEERARLLAELEAEFEAAERSIREEGTITAEELRKHLDAKFKAWEAEEAAPADNDQA